MSSSEATEREVFDPMWTDTSKPRFDEREIVTGKLIPTQFYADQPYWTATRDGGLLCVVTTGLGHEGTRGQHVLSMKTFDQGKTWENVVPVEDPSGPESSWGVPFTAPNGRVFVFYVHNTDDLRDLPADDPPYPGGLTQRMDSHGYYAFRWSDDHGRTWSKERGLLPVREFEIDRENSTGGRVRLFWNVGRAFSWEESLFLPLHKVGGLGEGWFTRSEGAFLRSDDLFKKANPLEAAWTTLPDGDRGIRAPAGGGPIAEEHSTVTLSDGSFFTVFRTIDGHPGCAYSRDQGASWEASQYMRFAEGRLMKHPRAANFVWKLRDGGYLYFFHNHGGKYLREQPERRTLAYVGRNPVWFCRGWEIDTKEGKSLQWSEPEIGLYDDDPMVRISYPDCIETEDGILFTETQKAVARVHRISPDVVAALSADPDLRGARLADAELLLDWRREGAPLEVLMPALPAFVARDLEPPYGGKRLREGFALDLTIRVDGPGSTPLARNRGDDGSGLQLEWTREGTLRIRLCDGQTEVSWESDPVPGGSGEFRLTVNVDGGSNTIAFYRDGIFNDGEDWRQYGWGRISPFFRNEYAGKRLEFFGSDTAVISSMRIYNRFLTSAEIQILRGK